MTVIIKRLFDFFVSLLLLVLLSPIFILISVLIRLDSPGPAIYKQMRVGKLNKPFVIYKFRSMYVNDIEHSASPSDSNDPRVTKIGRMIRKASLDELPQIFNVLKGDMSFIGPRAITSKAVELRVLAYADAKGEQIEKVRQIYINRHKVKPGLTGLTQVNGRSTAGIIAATELDYYYANNMSLVLDLKIFLKTLLILITRRGTN